MKFITILFITFLLISIGGCIIVPPVVNDRLFLPQNRTKPMADKKKEKSNLNKKK